MDMSKCYVCGKSKVEHVNNMCPPSSVESGGRRQDAANDTGSEQCRELINKARRALQFGRTGTVFECLDQLHSVVSARSADFRVLEQVVAYVEEWAVQKRTHAEEMRHKYEQAAHREECEARLLGRLSKALLEKFQNQSSESGQGPAR